MQDCREHLPSDLPVGANAFTDLIEPDIGGLNCLVECVEASRAHGILLLF
jgi:hypothetical protein